MFSTRPCSYVKFELYGQGVLDQANSNLSFNSELRLIAFQFEQLVPEGEEKVQLIHTQCYFIEITVAMGGPSLSFISLVGSPEVVNVSMAIKAFSNIKESNMASAHVLRLLWPASRLTCLGYRARIGRGKVTLLAGYLFW